MKKLKCFTVKPYLGGCVSPLTITLFYRRYLPLVHHLHVHRQVVGSMYIDEFNAPFTRYYYECM